MNALQRLVIASGGMHAADQIALVAVPIVAALVFDASPHTLGVLVACQSLAHLLGSLPFGVWVDRAPLLPLTRFAVALTAMGSMAAAVSAATLQLIPFALAVTFMGFGMVLFMLTTLSILPRLVEKPALASSNAQLDLARTLATFLVPLALGFALTGGTASLVFAVASLCAVGAWLVLRTLPPYRSTQTDHASITERLLAGAVVVAREPLLRAIALCATSWNFAFAALMVVAVPLLATEYGVSASRFGTVMAAFGLGSIAGAWTMRRFAQRVRPGTVLLFGPASSLLAATLMLGGAPLGFGSAVMGFFFLGFGPSMWLSAQNAVRQAVSPPDRLGRVNAVIQTAIYGVRPIGALVCGWIVGVWGVLPGMWLVVAGFALSLVAAVLGGLRAVDDYSSLNPRH